MTSHTATPLSRRNEFRVRFDSDGTILGGSMNSSLAEALDIGIDSQRDASIFTYVQRLHALDPELPARLADRIRNLIATCREFSISDDFQSAGADYHLHISGQAIRNTNEGITFTLLFIDDTEHTQLRRVYEYMFRLANHELKGPLACIVGAADYAEEHLERTCLDGLKTCLDMIQRNAHDIEDMIERYLNLSRIESGKYPLQFAEIRLSEDVLAPLTAQFNPWLARKAMSIEHHVDGEAHERMVVADAEKLNIVLRNLISNAVKYGDPGTTIRVVQRHGEAGTEIAVENAGKNIPEAQLDKLFRRFVRLDATQGTKGSGLGLYNARKVVELWGGTIWVDSHDNRTRFTFTIPDASVP